MSHNTTTQGITQARFTRQLFWHGTRLNLAPVPKIWGPAPSIIYLPCKWKNSWHKCPKFFHLHDKNGGYRAPNFRHRGQIQMGTMPKKLSCKLGFNVSICDTAECMITRRGICHAMKPNILLMAQQNDC